MGERRDLVDFHLPDEILAVIPTDPYDQLDVARKIMSMAIASRVTRLESDSARLRQQIAERDRTVEELREKVANSDRIAEEYTAVKKYDILFIADEAKGKKGKHAYERTVMTRSAKRREIENGGRDWVGLPDGILDDIAGLLLKEDVTHYIRFRGVCASFRRATLDPVITDPCFRPRNWILISEEPHLQRPKNPLRFLNLSTGKYIRGHVPELATIGWGRTFLSAADGLLVFIDDASTALHLLDPFTGALVSLPPLQPLFAFLHNYKGHELAIVIRKYLCNVNLASSSSASTALVVVVSFVHTLACAESGDTEWTISKVCMPLIQSFQDRLYSLCKDGELLRFEPDQNQFTTLYPSLSDPTLIHPPNHPSRKEYYLVASDGEMLLACLRSKFSNTYFQVFKVDLENGKLIPKENIGECALFIQYGRRAFLVSTSTFSSIVPNSIYYNGPLGVSTMEYHLIGCAWPSSWINVSPPHPNHLNLYCRTY
ncbi:hypothetical protein LUZ60_009011 [Juncus effusus]|nr:hypothetical protein LUZ60_009011 [Juncus effusus]